MKTEDKRKLLADLMASRTTPDAIKTEVKLANGVLIATLKPGGLYEWRDMETGEMKTATEEEFSKYSQRFFSVVIDDINDVGGPITDESQIPEDI